MSGYFWTKGGNNILFIFSSKQTDLGNECWLKKRPYRAASALKSVSPPEVLEKSEQIKPFLK